MTSSDDEALWYLAQTRPNCHQIAQSNLARQGFASFLPVLDETVRRFGQFRPILRPLFPGYVFVRLDPQQGRWASVKATTGITRLVGFGAGPAVVPDDLIAQIKARCDATGRLLPVSDLRGGEVVTLRQGPFADFTATVQQMDPDRRVWVLLDLMGAQTRVAVDIGGVRRRA